MTFLTAWLVLVGIALLGVPLGRWRRDIEARIAAEARATAAETEAAQWKHRAGELEDYLARVDEDHAAQIREWADRLQQVTAIGLSLDTTERTS